MHPAVQRILESSGISDQTRAPTGAYATRVYETLGNALFPQLLAGYGSPDRILSNEVISLIKLRDVFGPLGIDLVISDLREPTAAQLRSNLEKIATYAEFRESIMSDPDSIGNQCRRSLAELRKAKAQQALDEKELEALKAELASDHDSISVLEEQRNKACVHLKAKHAESTALAERARQAEQDLAAKQQQLDRIRTAITVNRESISTLKPFFDGKTGVVKSAKSNVEKLQVEVSQERARHKALLESNTQLERTLETLKGVETHLPGLQDTLKGYAQQQESLHNAQQEQAMLQAQYERKKRQLGSVEETVKNLESQNQQLRDQEAKLRRDVDNTGNEYDRSVASMKEEESRLTDEVSALRVSTGEIKQLLTRQREYNKQVLDLLQTAPQKIASIERELDGALGDITRIKIPHPNTT